jgi:hypothetical protein
VPTVPRSVATGLFALLALVSLSRAADAAPCGTENLLAGRLPSAQTAMTGNPAQLTDGIVGQEGAQWDAPVVVMLGATGGELIFDLGEPRDVGALFMQGDANDVYKVSGSLDGTPGSFTPIGQFGNVVSTGHGLRKRAVEIPPARLRYLRIGDASGDGYFSLSELGAYCAKPSPFPPALRVVASAPQEGNGVQTDRGWRLFSGIYIVAAGVAAWLAWRARRSSSSPTSDAQATTMKKMSNGTR